MVFAALYGKRGHECSLNTLRQHMSASSKSDLRMLPPTDDAQFNLHLLRAFYQLALYKTAHLSNPALSPATEFGRVNIKWQIVLIMNDCPSQAKHPATCFVQAQEVQVFEKLLLYNGWRVVLCTVFMS